MGFAGKNQETMTYKEYVTWNEDERCEVLDGKIINMASSPLTEHQNISMRLSIEFGTYLRGKTCRVFTAPIDVLLFEDGNKNWRDEDVKDWLIPDLIVCDPVKIKQQKIIGAPNLVAEIISPSSVKIDRMDKHLAYQRAGVKEYWIVDPANQIVEVYLLKGRNLELSNVYSKEDSLPVHTLDDFSNDLSLIFKNPCNS